MRIFGHRGAAGEAPENTIAGVGHALARGVDAIEIDLRLSADNQLVVVHDHNLQRTAGIDRLVKSYSAAELSRLNATASGPLWPDTDNCGVSAIEPFLSANPALRTVQLEMKSDEHSPCDELLPPLLEFLDNYRGPLELVVTSFDYELLEKLRGLRPDQPIGAISYKPEVLQTLATLNCEYLCVHYSICDEDFIRRARQHAAQLSVWTVNNPRRVEWLYEQGIDSIITDYPSMAVPLLSKLQRQSSQA